MSEVIRCNYVGYGPKAIELEARVSKATHRKYAFAVSSGHHALALAIRALDLPQPSLIALPVLTCASVLVAVHGAGHHVWLADIKEEDLTIDALKVSANAVAIITPHAYGAPIDIDAISRLDRPWIEDCATLPTGLVAGKPVGASGTFAVFSFGSTKYLTGGMGGMLLASDDHLATRVNDLLDFDRFEKRGAWSNGIPAALPGRMSDLNSALALAQWEKLSSSTAMRRKIAETYQMGLAGLSGLRLPQFLPGHGFYRYIVFTSNAAAPLAEKLRERGIDVRTSVNPWMDMSRDLGQTVLGGPWPVAKRWREHLLSLPIHPEVTDADAHWIVENIKTLMTK